MGDRGFPLRSAVHEHTLDNGLRFLLIEDRRSPVVAIVTHVDAGYFDEADDVVGISHVLEHMFFKGTARRGPGDLGRETKDLGGLLNASTIYDRTLYYTVVPSSGLEQALDIQSDALLNSTIDADELERELRVIIQEAKRKLDNPAAVARESLYETMFDRHRMRRWRIGTEAGLERLTRDDVVDFYRTFYRAPEVVLCVAGDIDTDATLDAIERFYGSMPGDAAPRDRGPAEPERREFRFRSMEGDIAQTYIEIGWRTPGILHADAPLLDLASLTLGQGRAARLYRGVRERGLATTIGALTYTPDELGLFGISAVTQPSDAVPALDAIRGVLEATRSTGIGDGELERARTMLEARLLSRFETVQGQAMVLAEWHALGDWRRFADYWDRLMKATAGEVDRALREHIAIECATVLVHRPEGSPAVEWSPERAIEPFEPDGTAVAPAVAGTPTEAGETTLERDEDGVRLYHGAGSRIVILARHEVPLVSIAITFGGGASEEDASRAGLTALMARTSIKGTSKRSAVGLAEESEALGGAIVTGVGADSLQWSITLPAKHVDAALDLLVDVVRNPTFPEAEFERERKAMLSAAKLLRDDMVGYPFRLMYEAAFAGDAYGVPLEDQEAAIAAARPGLAESWHARVAGERAPLLLLVGDVDPDVAQRAAAAFGPSAGAMPPEPEPAAWPDGPRRKLIEKDTAQSALAIAFRGPDRNHPDTDVLNVLAAAVAGLGGRLFEELRSRRSLAYSVAARPVARLRAGAFVGYIATSPDREEEARSTLIDELMRLTTDLLPASDVARARRYLVGARQIQRQTNRARLFELSDALLLGTGLEEIRNYDERIEAVTPEAIRDVAARWFDPDRIVEGIIRGTGRSR